MMDSVEQTALDGANKRDPGNPFVLSCMSFYLRKKFLSKRQVESLNQVSKTRTRGWNRVGRLGGGIDHDECARDYSGYSGNLNGDI